MMEKKNNPIISIVCPVYNEEDVIPFFITEILETIKEIGKTYEIIFINDGSFDNTLQVLLNQQNTLPSIKIINLSRNFGKESALTAGFDYASGEVIIPIDVDLQDPPKLIIEFIKHWENGSEVVVGKRIDRSEDTFLKRFTASIFYKIHNKISNVKIPENVGDYRLFTRLVLNAIKLLPENQRFMKGVFAWVGFKVTVVEYKRNKRKAGKTKFTGWKLWNFALEGITSFSTLPLRFWTYLGFIVSLMSFIYGSCIIIPSFIQGIDVPSYKTTIFIILFFGGLQLIGIGILGEYLGRIYIESKRRPIYIIDKIF